MQPPCRGLQRQTRWFDIPGQQWPPSSRSQLYSYLSGNVWLSREALVRYLNTLSEVAAARGPAVTKGSFLAGAYRELSVALIKSQGSVYHGGANLVARAAGRQVSPGAEVPYED